MVGSIQGLESQKKRTDPFIANTQHGTIVMSGVGKNWGINCLYPRESFLVAHLAMSWALEIWK